MQMISKLKTLSLGAMFTALVLGPVSHADDTEIFFGQSKDAFNTNPNILFILDTSGSMGSWDNAGMSRMDRMKIAMRVLLQESSSYNVGLMGFSGSSRGGSIHYPVGDLEQDSGNLCENGICPDERIVVKPEGGLNDATENDDTGVVTLNADRLAMAEVSSDNNANEDNRSEDIIGSAVAVAVVAESENSDGTETTRTITGASSWFYNGTPDSSDDRYAYRFENIDIPNGAVVTSASITFSQTLANAQTGNLSALIKVEAAANADPLPTAENGLDTIAERLVGATRSVQWNNIAPDTTTDIEVDVLEDDSTKSVTPDISEIVNLVVTLPNWEAGNALNFILDPVDEYTPSPADIREMYGVDAIESLRPVINYTYNTAVSTELVTTVSTASAHVDEITEQNTDVVSNNLLNTDSRLFFAANTHHPREVAFLFDDIAIPSNAEIQSASLTLTSSLDDASESPIEQWQAVNPDEMETSIIESASDSITTDNSAAPDTLGAQGNGTSQIGTPILGALKKNVVNINIKAETTGTPEPYNVSPLAGREFTTQFEPWEDISFESGESMTSPNLASVVAAVINKDTWSDGQSLSLMLSAPKSYNNIAVNSGLINTSLGAQKPQLQIVWKPGVVIDTSTKNSQTTAIRFSNVHIPPRATVKSARLVFNSSKASLDPVTLEISAEKDSASGAFKAVDNNLTGRQRTAKKVPWTPEPWELPDTKYDSVDFKDVVQEVINLPEWCGGNPLTVFLAKTSGTDSRYAVSADANEVSAPSLELTYEPGSVEAGAYCSNTTVISSIGNNNGDAVEDMQTGLVDVNGVSLDTINSTTDNAQLIGLRFPSLGLPKGAVVVSATLKLTHEKDITQAQDYKFSAIKTIASPEFGQNENSISNESREPFATTVTATVQPGAATESSFRIDVQPLVSAKVNDPDWEPGNPLIITAEALGGIAQSFSSYETDETQAPQLIIYYQSEREKPGTVYRDNLIAIVDSMVAQGGTPIVGAYYEAAQYYTGNKVEYGLQRGRQSSYDRYHRVSHPSSYIDGVVDRPSDCTDANLSASSCQYEKILEENGQSPTYVSPINSECQQSHIILLSDGEATSNSAANSVKNLTGNDDCAVLGHQECGVELATWLKNTDIADGLSGKQNVTTHTIGFNLDKPQFLQDLADAGGGEYYAAASSSELLNAFKNIFINVSKTDVSFVAPSATVSQSNRLKNRDDIYFSLFKPEGTARWAGNLKRYKLGGTTGENAEIQDVTGESAVDKQTGRFFAGAKSFWSNNIDGDSVLLGGAAEKIESDKIPHTTSRKVYTYTGHTTELWNQEYNELWSTNSHIKPEWLKLTTTLSENDDYIDNLLDWAHGKDVFDSDGDGNTDEARAQMGDPMHSQPLLVNYVGDRSVIHVATNEGYLHAVDHEHGTENFAFFPKELLPNLRRLYDDQVTTSRPYGLDGGLTVWIDDENKDGVVDPDTDKAYLYIGMRRGGNLYYALDITDPDKPRYLWSIAGGANTADTDNTTAEGNFIELGQTWSKPIKSKIYDDDTIRDVLIFGAGYSSNQDPVDDVEPAPNSITGAETPANDTRQKRETDSIGRGFFIVDAVTGELIWRTDQSFYPEMKYSVPSEIRVIDINFDGLVDQLYFGDMGGQVWRFDYNNDPAISANVDNRMNGGRIARFAGDTPETARRFYYPPDVALLSVDGEQQLSISVGSGWRAHPLDTDTEDRFYSFRMTQVYGAPTTEDGDIRYPEVTESTTGMIELSTDDNIRATNKQEKGWFLPLATAEKVLSSAVTVDGNLIFTTYIPSAETASCEAAIGSGAVYILDLATGNPVKNLYAEAEKTGESTEILTGRDRSRALTAPGIPPEATVLFPELGKATAFAGRETLDEVQIDTLKTRTFWQEHIEENL